MLAFIFILKFKSSNYNVFKNFEALMGQTFNPFGHCNLATKKKETHLHITHNIKHISSNLNGISARAACEI